MRPISKASDVLAVYTTGIPDARFGDLISAAWLDGTLLWSDNRIRGGPPYKLAETEDTRVSDALETLERNGLFADLPDANRCCLSSTHINILIRYHGKTFHTMSDHELFEDDARLVAESTAMTALGARQRYPVLATQPNAYLFSRYLWLEIRRVIQSLIPTGGKTTSGQLHFDTIDSLSWINEEPGIAEQ